MTLKGKVQADEKRSIHVVCKHLKEAWNAAIGRQMHF